MIEQMKAWDEHLLLVLNQFHVDWLDPFILLITRTEFWIPMYVVLIILIFKTYKRQGWIIMIAVMVCVVLTDRITAGFMKPYFHRLRPSHEPSLEGIVHLVQGYRSELYGFASGHAANTMGVTVLCYLLLRKRYRWASLLFLWPIVMMYSRIYLGAHYPGDILVGAIIGTACGYIVYRLYKMYINKWPQVLRNT